MRELHYRYANASTDAPCKMHYCKTAVASKGRVFKVVHYLRAHLQVTVHLQVRLPVNKRGPIRREHANSHSIREFGQSATVQHSIVKFFRAKLHCLRSFQSTPDLKLWGLWALGWWGPFSECGGRGSSRISIYTVEKKLFLQKILLMI